MTPETANTAPLKTPEARCTLDPARCTWTRTFDPGTTEATFNAALDRAADLLWWHGHYKHPRPATPVKAAA